MTQARVNDGQMLDEATSMLDAGSTRSELLTQFRTRWNISLNEAEDLYRRANGVRNSQTSDSRRLEQRIHAANMRAESRQDIGVGLGFLLVGVAVTIITFLAANFGAGIYFVFWGPVLYGALRVLKGIFMRARSVQSGGDAVVSFVLSALLIAGVGIVVAITIDAL